MGPWVVTASIAAILVAVVVGAMIVGRVRRGRRVAAEHLAEEALREEVFERFRHVRAEWDGPEVALASTPEPGPDPDPTRGPSPMGPGASDDPWEGPAHLAGVARRGPAARVARGAVALLALTLVVAAALTWFTSR